MTREIIEPFGPEYPRQLGAAVAKFRAATKRKGLAALSKAERRAYGDAVEKAILAKQRAEANHGLPAITPRAYCASGTPYNNGADIIAAVLRRQRSELANCASAERRARTPHQWRQMYAEAMAEKRARLAKPTLDRRQTRRQRAAA